jgi:Transposase DDE domain group 1
MKFSRTETVDKSHRLPALRFEEQQLTSFSGLIVFQQLFALLDLREQLRRCFRHLNLSPIFGHARIVLVLIIHFLLGYRQLRELRYYCDDPLVKRVVGLKRLPDVATVSRALAGCDAKSVAAYYPLFCTVAQSAQVLDVLHRSGNVHDSNGAQAFIGACIEAVRAALGPVRIEIRMDAAFFSDAIVQMLDTAGVQYTISVPFERLPGLKQQIEQRQRWQRASADCDSFELSWKPKSWQRRYRFLVFRKRVKLQHKEPVQLDLFVPYQYGYEFRAILTNKRLTPAKVLAFHNGRGAQEGIFAELKSDNALAYVPTRTWVGNQIYLLAALMAHNLARELQMRAQPPARNTTAKRAPLWAFASIATLRHHIIQRAGRLIRPQGQLTLSMSLNDAVKNDLLHFLDALGAAA